MNRLLIFASLIALAAADTSSPSTTVGTICPGSRNAAFRHFIACRPPKDVHSRERKDDWCDKLEAYVRCVRPAFANCNGVPWYEGIRRSAEQWMANRNQIIEEECAHNPSRFRRRRSLAKVDLVDYETIRAIVKPL